MGPIWENPHAVETHKCDESYASFKKTGSLVATGGTMGVESQPASYSGPTGVCHSPNNDRQTSWHSQVQPSHASLMKQAPDRAWDNHEAYKTNRRNYPTPKVSS